MENSEHINDVDASFSSPSGIRTKRSPSWFLDTSKPEFIPSKKQAAETESSKLSSGISFAGPPSWDNTFQTVPNQFIDRLFGSQITRPINYAERNISAVVTDNDLNARAKSVDDQYGQDITVGLSMTHGTEDPQMCLNYGGIKKVNVNQAKDNEIEMHAPIDQGPNLDNSNDLSTDHVFVNESETGFMSIGQTCNKEQDNVMLMGHSYCSGHSVGRPTSQEDNHRRGDVNIISFSFAVQQETVAVGRPVGSYDQICNHSSVQTSKAICEEDLDASNINIIMNTDRMTKPRTELVLKNKPDNKAVRKEAPNSFPSNVRSLISTGMLEGIPIKYVSLAKKELRGIIKGSGYLCACQTCKYSKVLNAYEFERHADCKTKHPNNHIYFENGKTIYQIVQELRSTPESFLFDTIKTIFGAPIDQKAFRIWKESYQAATRELQRIYGKEELNV